MQHEFAQLRSDDARTQLLAETPLGDPLAEYRVKVDAPLLVGSLLALFFFLFFTVFGVYVYQQSISPHNTLSALGALLIFVVALFLFGRWLLRPWWHLRTRLLVCRNGLAWLHYRRLTGYKLKRVALWEEITSVTSRYTDAPESHSLSGHTPIYTLVTTSGVTVKLRQPFEQMNQLGRTIEEEVVQQLLPGALDKLRGGRVLTFGHISLDIQGISDGKQNVRWHEVARVETTAQYLNFEVGQAWGRAVSLRIDNIPNGALLVALMKYTLLVQKH